MKIRLRPRLGGLRILSLDGGGARGIVQSAVLLRLEQAIGLDLPIGDYFDFVAGSGTGEIPVPCLDHSIAPSITKAC